VDGLSPVLQLDCHGDDAEQRGLVLTSGELMTWAEVAMLLRGVNHASHNSLFVVSSMCWGAYLDRSHLDAFAQQHTPFWGFMGPTKKTSGGKLEDGLKAFYRVLLHEQKPPAAVEAFSQVVGDTLHLTAELVFARAFQHAMRASHDPRDLQRRIEAIRQETGFRGSDEEIALRIKDEQLLARLFEALRKKHLLIDEFPEIADRFHLRFEDLSDPRFAALFGDQDPLDSDHPRGAERP
jgi:hypothetical protein